MKRDGYIEYYERLARGRESLRNKLIAESKVAFFWSALYKNKYKETLYEIIGGKTKSTEFPLYVLDAGCGYGADLVFLSKKYNFKGFGADLSLTQVKAASENNSLGQNRFFQCDMQNLAFKDSSFDIVIFSEVIEHLPNPMACLREIRRVLKDEGLLFLTTPNRWDYFNAIGRLIPKCFKNYLKGLLLGETPDIDSSRYVTEYGVEEHLHLFSLSELKHYLGNIGFKVEDIQYGKLRVIFPRLFDKTRFLQNLWIFFDDTFSIFACFRCLKSSILLICSKYKNAELKSVDIFNYLNSIFSLNREEVIEKVSLSFYNYFQRQNIFTYPFKFKFHYLGMRNIYELTQAEDKIVLDLGCGFGLNSIIFASLGAKTVYGIDISNDTIEGCRKLGPMLPISNVHYKVGNGTEIEYPDEFFDVVIAIDVISHVLDLDLLISEVKRVLKRRGVFYIYESNNVFDIRHKIFLRRFWKAIEEGPVDSIAGIEKSYREIRRDMIKEHFPSLDQKILDYLARQTQGMWGNEIYKAVEEYLDKGKITKKIGFPYIDPHTGEATEIEYNPFRVKRLLKKHGFHAEVIRPYFCFTYPYLIHPFPNNSFCQIIKVIIKRISRYFYPFSLLLTPQIELLARKRQGINYRIKEADF